MAEIIAARYGGTGVLLRDKARIEAGQVAATAAAAPLSRG
jgi:hypothetical protein